MRKFLLAVAALALFTSSAHAQFFFQRSTTCVGGNCGTSVYSSGVYGSPYPYASPAYISPYGYGSGFSTPYYGGSYPYRSYRHVEVRTAVPYYDYGYGFPN
jgi:hypothetical protein